MPYITPTPISSGDNGTDFLLDLEDNGEDQEDDKQFMETDYNESMLDSMETAMMGE